MAKEKAVEQKEATIEQKEAAPTVAAVLTEAQKKEFSEEAMKRVCAALGQNYEDIISQEDRKKDDERLVVIDLGNIECSINGTPYRGIVTVPYSVGEMLQHMASSKRSRLLNEKIGHDYEVRMMVGGGISSVLKSVTQE